LKGKELELKHDLMLPGIHLQKHKNSTKTVLCIVLAYIASYFWDRVRGDKIESRIREQE